MSGRRNHSRYAIANPEGVLRVLRDVDVRRGDGHELIALSSEAGIPGEVLTIEFVNEAGASSRACVVESRPVMVGGSLRHQLRLRPLEQSGASRTSARVTETQ
jgi:hypothetical protein